MSVINRITTWVTGQILKAADLNGEFNNVVNVLNNLDSASSSWTNVKATTGTFTSATITTLANILMNYRRPVLQYNSASVVNIETGVNGVSGQLQIVFPDGSIRTDSTTGRIQCNTAQTAALTGTAQSGIRSGSVVNNTWYAIYAVKSQVNTTDIVAVADTVLPIQANFSTLNSNFGTNSWVYIGMIAYGDNSGVANQINTFVQSGNFTQWRNTCAGNGTQGTGILLATQSVAGATLTYTYVAGTAISSAQIPNHIHSAYILAGSNNAAQEIVSVSEGAGNIRFAVLQSPSGGTVFQFPPIFMPIESSVKLTSNSATPKHDIYMIGYIDGALGVGSNPIL